MPRNPTELLIRELRRLTVSFRGSSGNPSCGVLLADLVEKAIVDFEVDTEAAKKPRKGKE